MLMLRLRHKKQGTNRHVEIPAEVARILGDADDFVLARA
jgi:hypothetical protein